MNDENLENGKPYRFTSGEMAVKNGSKGGKAKARNEKTRKTTSELIKTVMDMDAPDSAKEQLEKLGLEENDLTNRAVFVVQLAKKALEGDEKSIRLLMELEGELKGGTNVDINVNTAEASVPLMIPENGRDKPKAGIIGPQPGPQTLFMCSPADIIVYGGAAGGGKTYALLLEALRHMDNSGFRATIFRKNYTQIVSEGGLWDTATQLYSQIPGAESRKNPYEWRFPSGARISFSAIDRDDSLRSWQGSQIAYIAFDELTHFSKRQFMYMYSRNRSTCGVKPYIRATCNPDADSWVAKLIEWYIDPDTGYPISARSGVIRYMAVQNDEIIWGDTEEELEERYGLKLEDCKTFTFIASNLQDNRILMETNPQYLSSLKAMAKVDMERLLYGNWKIRPKAGLMFKRTQARMLDVPPRREDMVTLCRGWDLAATSEDERGDPAYTASVLMAKMRDGTYTILHVTNNRLSAGDAVTLVKQMAMQDKAMYGMVTTRLPQDPGQAGKAQAQAYIRDLAGYSVQARTENGDKTTRAMPVSAQWQHGFVAVVAGEWNEQYFDQLECFPDSRFKDMVDATSSAFDELTNYNQFNIDNML